MQNPVDRQKTPKFHDNDLITQACELQRRLAGNFTDSLHDKNIPGNLPQQKQDKTNKLAHKEHPIVKKGVFTCSFQ